MTELALAGHRYAEFEWVKAMGWDITGLSEVLGCTLGEPQIDLQYFIKAHPFAESLEGLDYPSDFLKGAFPCIRSISRCSKRKSEDKWPYLEKPRVLYRCCKFGRCGIVHEMDLQETR